MKQSSIERLHNAADAVLIRNRSLLDIMAKLQDTASKVNRTAVKAVTHCGCLTMDAKRQCFPADADFSRLSEYASDHTAGRLCERCRDFAEQAIGDHLFYLACLCNVLRLDLDEIACREVTQLELLGKHCLK